MSETQGDGEAMSRWWKKRFARDARREKAKADYLEYWRNRLEDVAIDQRTKNVMPWSVRDNTRWYLDNLSKIKTGEIDLIEYFDNVIVNQL